MSCVAHHLSRSGKADRLHGIFQPSALELLDMIRERQGGRDVTIKLPRGMLEHGLSFAGAGENGRRAGWIRRNVKLSERIYTGWDRLTEDEQLQIVRKIWDLEKKMEISSQGGGTSSQLLNAKVVSRSTVYLPLLGC